jgi:hypothetical protein
MQKNDLQEKKKKKSEKIWKVLRGSAVILNMKQPLIMEQDSNLEHNVSLKLSQRQPYITPSSPERIERPKVS